MYAQIMEQILAKVMAGDWRAGHPLPSIRELAGNSHVSVITVKRAYLELEHAGVIVTRQGKGSFVADTHDATRTLAPGIRCAVDGLLDAASKLGLSRRKFRQVRASAVQPGGSMQPPSRTQPKEAGMTASLSLRGVHKQYADFALQDIDLELPAGQIMGLVGVNGAGKSTLLRILMGLIQADSGEVEIRGHRLPHAQVAAKREIGYASEDMRLYKGKTLRWHMDFIRTIYPGWDEVYAASC